MNKPKKSESVGQTLPQLPWKRKGGFKKKMDSFHQTSSNFVGISTVVCGSFWRVDKIQNVVTMETEVPK